MSDELGLDVDVRKIVTFIEEVHTEVAEVMRVDL